MAPGVLRFVLYFGSENLAPDCECGFHFLLRTCVKLEAELGHCTSGSLFVMEGASKVILVLPSGYEELIVQI